MAEKINNPTMKNEAQLQTYVDKFYSCREKEPPFCVSACPFHVDVIDFIEKIGRGSYNAAFKPYRNAVCFPDIVAQLCPQYCGKVCPRGEDEGCVQLNLLEKTCVARTKKKDPRDYNVPKKEGRVAIIGAGPSGMAMAQRMTARKYTVEIFEKTDRIGGHLWELLPPEIFVTDIERQLQFEEYELHFNREIKDLQELYEAGFDAVYVATGKGGNDFGILKRASDVEGNTWYCFAQEGVGVFAGGSLLGKDTMFAIADGLNVAYSVQGWLQTKVLDYPKDSHSTRAALIGRQWEKNSPVIPSDKAVNDGGKEMAIFTEEEAKEEVSRCIKCRCDGCREYCDLLAFYDKWPFRVKEEVVATVVEGECLLNGKPAKRLVNTCTQCGLCKEICPEAIDIGGLAMAGRRILHRQGKMPFAYHQFFLNDMDFANGPLANLTKSSPAHSPTHSPTHSPAHSPTQQKSGADLPAHEGKDYSGSNRYAFYPGCQLGASDPDLVIEAYSYLLEHEPSTGLMLGCCGVPAEWSGDPERLAAEHERIRSEWESLGKPVLILACATCAKQFEQYFPEIETVFLYELMEDWGIETEKKAHDGKQYSVFDPCSTRGKDDLRESVRTLAEKAGYILDPLKRQEEHSACCSYGGQGAVANPPFTEFTRKRRIEEGENPYIAYCINCRDAFLEEGKESYHILDLLFSKNPNEKPFPTVTDRRHNRVKLKERALKEFWGETMEEKMEEAKVKLIISPELQAKLHKDKTLEEDVAAVVEFCERTKRSVHNTRTDTYTGYKEIGYMTYWAEYKKTDEPDTFELVNAYSHRIRIELEGIWNGKKVDLDMQ